MLPKKLFLEVEESMVQFIEEQEDFYSKNVAL
jgi:hypothetical protein